MTEEESRVYQKTIQRLQELIEQDKLIQSLEEKLTGGTATYQDAWDYANRVGRATSTAMIEQIDALISGGIDGYETIMEALYEGYDKSAVYAAAVQTIQNKKAGLGIKGQQADFDRDRASGIAHLGSNAEDATSAARYLGTPVEHFTENVVGDTIKANEAFQYQSGLNPKIKRTSSGKCCQWCDEIAGVYDYPAPEEVYRRHQNCNCLVEYYPGNGLKQNAHTKTWAVAESSRITHEALLEQEESNKQRKSLDKSTLVDPKILKGSVQYKREIDSITESSQESRGVYQAGKEMLKHRNGTHFEDLAFVDSTNGKWLINKDYDSYDPVDRISSSKPNGPMEALINGSEAHTIIGVHNHPSSMTPSLNDYVAAAKRKYKYGVVLCHNGDVYKYTVSDEFVLSDGFVFAVSIFDEACDKRNIEDIAHAIEGIKKYGVEIEVKFNA